MKINNVKNAKYFYKAEQLFRSSMKPAVRLLTFVSYVSKGALLSFTSVALRRSFLKPRMLSRRAVRWFPSANPVSVLLALAVFGTEGAGGGKGGLFASFPGSGEGRSGGGGGGAILAELLVTLALVAPEILVDFTSKCQKTIRKKARMPE